MVANATTRMMRLSNAVVAFLAASSACLSAVAQPGSQPQTRPMPQMSRPQQMPRPQNYPQPYTNPPRNFSGQGRSASGGAVMGPQNGSAPRGEHLSQWMQQHGNMTVQQQQRALQREPGFNQLPQTTQQRMMDRLNRLNSMPEQQRERVLQRGEAMERLDPQQRVQVRSAMGQLGALPEDRRRAVARSFRELRTLPADQRNQIINSPEYRQQFSDEERGTLGNLLSVSPMLPPSR